MNVEMAYLLGMICGNGSVQRKVNETIISISIPHKKLETEDFTDVQLYVKASIVDIRSKIEPLIGYELQFIQQKRDTILSFCKPNTDYLIREILRFIGNATSHDNIKLNNDFFSFSTDEKRYFLRGFADVTGYIRRSNAFIEKHKHRVYLEIPHNWFLVIDICNLLKSIDIPVQTIDWGHPNMRDGNCKKYNNGQHNFWKKEHQIKIWANEFLPIGFSVIHKNRSLQNFANEFIDDYNNKNKNISLFTHRYYWETKDQTRIKQEHPSENDMFIPSEIRGKHFDSWKEIASELGYGEFSKCKK